MAHPVEPRNDTCDSWIGEGQTFFPHAAYMPLFLIVSDIYGRKIRNFFELFGPPCRIALADLDGFTPMCAGLCPTYCTTFGSAEKNRNGSCPMHEWDHSLFWVFNSPSTRPPGAAGPRSGKRHVVRHCPYIHKIWCGSVHALLRYRSKTTKMQNSPLTPIVTKISLPTFSAPQGTLTPKRGEDTSGTTVRPHAEFGVNRPAGCREIVDKKRTKKQTYSKTNTSPFALTSEWRVKTAVQKRIDGEWHI